MKNKVLPDFYGILEVQHYMSGRIRLKVNDLIREYKTSENLKEHLEQINGICMVRVNPILGTVLVEFDESMIDSTMIIGIILRILNLEERAFSRKSGIFSVFFSEIIEVCDNVIFNKTKGILDIRSTLTIIFLYYGVKKIRQNPILPNGVNLLWWAYGLVSNGSGNNDKCN